MKVVNPGSIDAKPTAPVDLHLWEVYVRTNLLILDLVHLDDGDTGGDTVSSVTHDGHEAILEEVVGPGRVVCVSIIRATTGARPIVGDEGQHGRKRYPQE